MKYVAEAGYALSQKDIDASFTWNEKLEEHYKNTGKLNAGFYATQIYWLLNKSKDQLTPKQLKHAFDLLDKGLKLEPKNLRVLKIKGDLYAAFDKINEAKAEYKKILEYSKGTDSEKYYTGVISKALSELEKE